MHYAERSRHVWNIEDIRFWSYTSPILGPEFDIDCVDDVKFSFSLEVRENRGLTLVFKGIATPTSPCWMPLRVSASVLTPEHEEVSLTTKDVDPFTKTSTTLFSLDSEGKKWLTQDNLKLLVRTEERLASIPSQITQEYRIPSSKEVKMCEIFCYENRIPPNPTTVKKNTKGKSEIAFYFDNYRCTNPPPNDYVQSRFYSNATYYPCQLRIRQWLVDWKRRVRRTGKESSFIFRKKLEVFWLPEFIPLSILSDEDLNGERNIRQEVQFSFLDDTPNLGWTGNNHSTHSYRHVFLDSVTPYNPDILHELKRDRWTDLNLLTDDGNAFPVHRCVLIARSKYFEAMLTSNMAEKDKSDVLLKDVDSSVLGHLLDFLYSCTISEDLSVETTVDLYLLANYFEVLELCGFCLHHIMKKLRLSNVLSVLPLLHLHWDADLGREATELIASNAEEVFQSPIWKEWKEKCPGFCEKFVKNEMDRTDTGSSTSHSCDNSPSTGTNEAYELSFGIQNVL